MCSMSWSALVHGAVLVAVLAVAVAQPAASCGEGYFCALPKKWCWSCCPGHPLFSYAIVTVTMY